MGLDYQIKTYIKKEKLSAGLKWLFENSHSLNEPAPIRCNNETSFLNGNGFIVNRSQKITGTTIIEDFTVLHYSTSLIFDIDPKVISSIADFMLGHDHRHLQDFKDHFEQCYLGKGKISIGNFDTTIRKMKNSDVYELVFTAVTSDMSLMIGRSIAVKKWVEDFGKAAGAILSYVDKEEAGRNVYCYKGRPLTIILHTNYDTWRYAAIAGFFDDYRALQRDREWPKPVQRATANFTVIESPDYTLHIENTRWLISSNDGRKATTALNDNQIAQFKKEGKPVTDKIYQSLPAQ
jgi:hypothetical protein